MSDKWTIMVYISADDVLANFAIESLKQLRDTASERMVVVAQFDANQHQDAGIYLFDGSKGGTPIEDSRVGTIRYPVDTTAPETLTRFIDYACAKSKTERYCLILWGHGPELLLDEERRFEATKEPSMEPIRRYLTPSNLRNAIRDTKLALGQLESDHPKSISDKERAEQEQPGSRRTLEMPEERHALDIIGIDACSMSMVELASELQRYVDFMIASQEDVPDASFPYEKFLSGLRGQEIVSVREKCEIIPKLYQQAFRDYIASPSTGMRETTLASLSLTKIQTITAPLNTLATALLASRDDEYLAQKIFAARVDAQDFVFGLFVDLYDFCLRLNKQLAGTQGSTTTILRSACKQICAAIEERNDGCIIENQPDRQENRCHGLSIYFPYRDEDETDKAEEERWAKGGTRRPLKERTARIKELEEDFELLDQFAQTKWTEFIKHGWSWILASQEPPELDKYYSAEQCIANLLSLYKSQSRRVAATAA